MPASPPANPQTRQKIDLHMHTIDDPMDPHVWHTAEELIDKASGLGFTALAITLHEKQFESDRIRAYAAERGILLIPGVEQTVEGAHVLLLNFDRETADSIHTFEALRKAKRESGPRVMVIAAHPFYPNAVALNRKFFDHSDVFDALEISGYHHRWWNPNEKARQAAKQFNLPVVGNSDTHTLEQFGTIWTEVESETSVEAILTALKRGAGHVRSRFLRWDEMLRITYKVVARGYMPWIDYKKKRGLK